jgi:hypothetical protein
LATRRVPEDCAEAQRLAAERVAMARVEETMRAAKRRIFIG